MTANNSPSKSPTRALALFAVLMIFSLTAAPSLAEDGAGLEDLLMEAQESISKNVVVGASRKAESLNSSASIVTIITRSQIEAMHPRSIYEILSKATGIEANESYFGMTTLNFRGILQNIYNSKILVVVNGHPLFESVNGHAALEMIPLPAIAKIEVIRGPGSVLYGTNAYAGMVNITTIDGRGYEKSSVSLNGGSFGRYGLSFGYVGREEEVGRGSLFVGGNLAEDDGWRYKVASDEKKKAGEIPYIDKVNSVYANYRIGAFTLQLGHFKQKKSKLGITPVLDYTGLNDISGTMVDLSWDWKLKPGSSIKARFRLDSFTRDMNTGYFPARPFLGHDSQVNMESDSDSKGFELYYDKVLSDRVHMISGVLYEEFASDPYAFLWLDDGTIHPLSAYLDNHKSSNKAIFAQFDVTASSKLNLLGALRVNENSLSGRGTVPRLGAVLEAGKDFFIKVMYGKAFRNASFFERYVATKNVLFGSENLSDEKIEQWDLAFDKKFSETFEARLNFFRATTDDLINRVNTADPVTTGAAAKVYANTKGQEIEGIELEMRSNPHPRLETLLNATYRKGHNLADGTNIDNFSKFIGNLSLGYDLTNGWKFNTQVQHFGSRQILPSYSLIDASLDYSPDKQNTFSLIIKNLTDKEYEVPEYNRGIIPTLPGGPPRAFYLEYRRLF